MGFGYSAKPRDYNYSLCDQATLHERLLESLNIERARFLCHDYGDSVGQELLARVADGALTFANLLPGGAMPQNPFTAAATTLDWSNVLASPPTSDNAGGVALNVVQTVVGGAFDAYDILGEDDQGVALSLVLTNQ